MLTGTLPFNGNNPQMIYQKILLGRINFPSFLDPVAVNFISGLLEQNPSKRLGSKEGCNNVKNHEWLSSMDFNLLISKETGAPWVPEIVNEFDTSYFDTNPETIESCPEPKIMTARDPFAEF
jgi:serine/threonine protein kinase